MKPTFKFTDKPRKLQSYRVGELHCPNCEYYKMNVIVPIDKKAFEKYDEHVNACVDLTRLQNMEDSLKTPEILEQIEKNKERIVRGYN